MKTPNTADIVIAGNPKSIPVSQGAEVFYLTG